MGPKYQSNDIVRLNNTVLLILSVEQQCNSYMVAKSNRTNDPNFKPYLESIRVIDDYGVKLDAWPTT